MRPRVLVGQALPDEVMASLREVFEVVPVEGPRDRPDVLGAATSAVGILGFAPPRPLLDRARGLRAVSTVSAGYDTFDVDDLTRRGVLLMNCPDALTETTADLAFALILAAARRVAELDAWVKAGRWTEDPPEGGFGVDVHGKTLGVVGLGRIGAAIARRGALGFGMRVLYAGPSAKPEAERQYGAVRRDLDALLAEADFMCLAMPLRKETDGLIGARELRLMKRSAILVNIARGRVVDEEALIAALREGRLRAAGLDVFQREPLPLDSPLLGMPNVVALPHVGSATRETRDAMARSAADNLIRFLTAGEVRNAVNPAALEGPR
ncbi:MAG: 2-hydroxyacid dehydrogenase [Fimbriimonas sp.]